MVVLQLVTYYWYFQSYTLSYEIIMAIYHFHIDLNIVHLLTLKRWWCKLFGVNKVHYDIWDNGEWFTPPHLHHHHPLLSYPISFNNYAHFIIFSFSVVISTKLNILEIAPITYKSKVQVRWYHAIQIYTINLVKKATNLQESGSWRKKALCNIYYFPYWKCSIKRMGF